MATRPLLLDSGGMKKRNHVIWIGLLVTFAGLVSYFMVFARFASLRDFPWVNLPMVLLGVALSALGMKRALATSATWRGKALAGVGLTLSLMIAALFVAYIFWITYTLPAPSELATGLIRAPNFALTSSTGETVRLSDFAGREVVLIFYRGFW